MRRTIKIEFDREYFTKRIATLGYKSCREFCVENGINHNTICNTIYRHHLSLDMLCRLALLLFCKIDDLLIYPVGESGN